MPDLKSELAKVINSWETPVSTETNAHHKVTTNSTRLTFNYVRDNPGITRSSAVAGLSQMGVPTGSSASLITTMIARGNLRVTAEGALFAAQPEYKPLPKPKSNKPKAKKVEAAESPKIAEPAQINSAWDAETLLDNLSIKQARALYDELRTIFGG